MVLLTRGKNDGIAVYIPKKINLKEMAAKIKLIQHFFFNLVR
jgi:nitrogen fixation protein